MENEELLQSLITPAFICDIGHALRRARVLRAALSEAECKLLFSVKALAVRDLIIGLCTAVDGFSVSSLFEARLVRECAGSRALINFVSPLVRTGEVGQIAELCDRVTLNSLSQLRSIGDLVHNAGAEVGLRVNPGMSFVNDCRYDPCGRDSKLGVTADEFASVITTAPQLLRNVSGIHFHSNCDSSNLEDMQKSILRVESALARELGRFRWMNAGGGYLFDDMTPLPKLTSEMRRVRNMYGTEIVFEPGAAVSRSAGMFVSTVGDIINGREHPVAILDITVNHWPEVFEFQFEPDVVGHIDDGSHTYLLAGCSCLAGDVFGEYSFDEPLEVGSRVVFANAGAYSIVKAHMFNGINLPHIYVFTEDGELILRRSFNYDDFASRWGVDTRAVV